MNIMRATHDLVSPLLSVVTLPDAELIELGERGVAFACDIPGPRPDAPVLLLVHGLGATALLNWAPAFQSLSSQFRVVALDLRGHGRSSAPERRFRLSDCADDVAAAARALGIEHCVLVGYSMGSQVAQLVWRRHPDLIQGLVLCAAARNFKGKPGERLFFTALPAVMGAVQLMLPAPPAAVRQQADAFEAEPGPTVRRLPGWAWEEFRRTPPSALFKALSAIGSFSSRDWVGEIDVPTAVVVMMRDRGVPPTRQIKLAQSIPGATIHPVDAGHAACMFGSQRFVPVLLEACASVASRIAHPR
ncbi:MAG: alpha/beta fold hydrolase [Actinobacteria bacterium]|nr:MAG: alpha/beta fold hydrolase [Actinomycetota bacterium]